MKKKGTISREEQQQISLSREQRTVSNYLKKLKFSPKLMGGVDEADVWKKIEKLCELYEMALEAERAKVEELEEQLYPRGRGSTAKAEQNRVWDELIQNMESAEQECFREESEAEES